MKLVKSTLKASALSLILLVICSCAYSGASNQSSFQAAKKHAEPQPTATPAEVTNPTQGYSYEGLAQAWSQFTESGQFRLARADEMNFPESARREWASDWERASKPFKYAWGQRGFDTDRSHLVSIVVDTTRNDPQRFSLVIFSSLRGSNEYRPYPLYSNRDLSTTMISAPSGYLMLSEYGGDGSKKSCDVFWSKKLKQYYCRSMKG